MANHIPVTRVLIEDVHADGHRLSRIAWDRIAVSVGQEVDDENWNNGKWEHFEWDVTLLYQKRSYKTTFRCGIGHAEPELYVRGRKYPGKPKPPTAADVLSCLCSDATSADRVTFEDWCSDLGYDADSRKAEKVYQACVETNARLRVFLGQDFDLFASAEH